MNILLASAALSLLNGLALGQASAEVVARKGPLELTLRVYDTRLKLHNRIKKKYDLDKYNADSATGGYDAGRRVGQYLDPSSYRSTVTVRGADPIWFQIELKNIGKRPFWVSDHDLFDGDDRQFTNALLHGGLRVILEDASGKEVSGYDPGWGRMHGCPGNGAEVDGSRRPSYLLSPDLQRVYDEARKKGLSPKEAASKVDARRHEQEAREAVKAAPGQSYHLAPGQSVVTREFVYTGPCPGDRPDAPTPPPGRYAELYTQDNDIKHLDKPGRYRIYAVYDHAITAGMRELDRRLHLAPLKPGSENIFLKTPEIPIEVVR